MVGATWAGWVQDEATAGKVHHSLSAAEHGNPWTGGITMEGSPSVPPIEVYPIMAGGGARWLIGALVPERGERRGRPQTHPVRQI